MPDERTVTITQPPDERFALDHGGRLAVSGDDALPALSHRVVHGTAMGQPVVHMVCWDEEQACRVDVSGRVTIAGDAEAPVRVTMRHHFENDHRQTHHIATRLADPIHHALQMRTPLQLRFCNPWHIASDYIVEVNLGNNRVVSMRLTGATVATPQPCGDDGCPPTDAGPVHP
jgi:hypothetical protein